MYLNYKYAYPREFPKFYWLQLQSKENGDIKKQRKGDRSEKARQYCCSLQGIMCSVLKSLIIFYRVFGARGGGRG
jgi:hypothetical protein